MYNQRGKGKTSIKPKEHVSFSIAQNDKSTKDRKLQPQESEHMSSLYTSPNSYASSQRLAAGDIAGVLAVRVVGLAEEVVDPLEEIGESEALGESLAGAAILLVGGAGLGRDRSLQDR
jgi:hypothetical protein